MTGSMGSVTATLNGISDLTLFGVQKSVSLRMSGISTVIVEQAPNSKITGSSSGIATVEFAGGSCDITTPFSNALPFGMTIGDDTCVQYAPSELTVPEPEPTWTCGLAVEGNFT